MTIRHKLADWISGGELTRLRDAEAEAIWMTECAEAAWEARCSLMRERDKARKALAAIHANETPSANATVRRMARIAREALE